MMDCDTFLAEYSAYRDGEVSWAEREAFDAHLDACPSCARYDEVVRRGADVFRSLPELEVSDDFMDRLKHRIYSEDLEMRRVGRRGTPGAALATAAIAAGVALFAWVPLMQPRERLVSLPAVAAEAPRQTLVRRLITSPLHPEATGLTSRLAQIGVAVEEMPYHDLVFRPQGPVVGQLAAFIPSLDDLAPQPAGR
jgi:anti-sigma factor RsiW